MSRFARRMLRTLQLMLFALLPPGGARYEPPKAAAGMPPGDADGARIQVDGVTNCAPRRIRGGMDNLLNSKGELRLFFPDCLAIAAPVLLFRLKREGFSRCSVAASEQGLLVQGMR